MGGLKNKYLFLTDLGARKFTVKARGDSVPAMHLLPGSQTALFSLSPNVMERRLANPLVSSYKSIMPLMRARAP